MKHEPCIATQILPGMRFRFAAGIDLMDETLREGAERASVPPDLGAKCALAKALAQCGIKSLVVGMFPDVPHNIELLAALLRMQTAGEIAADVRFMVISHVGITMQQTFAALDRIPGPKSSVWIIAIHSVSDMQIEHLFPVILRKDPLFEFDVADWQALPVEERRRRNLEWLDVYLPSLRSYRGGGIMAGLIDTFRADRAHLKNAVEIVARHGIRQVRLLDSAGTCMPHQLPLTVGELIDLYPGVSFYGHFHDDFGMATANAIVGLSMGLKGVDVSVGGFANRAGHAPLAEVAMALRQLYGVELPGFSYESLYQLSRLVERTYGLMENPAQAITGVITHAVQTGIRTELLRKAPKIFDVVDPAEIGSALVRMFGVRSGRDGLLRFLTEKRETLAPLGIEPSVETADRLFQELDAEWQRRSLSLHQRSVRHLDEYQRALNESFFSEAAMIEWLTTKVRKEVSA